MFNAVDEAMLAEPLLPRPRERQSNPSQPGVDATTFGVPLPVETRERGVVTGDASCKVDVDGVETVGEEPPLLPRPSEMQSNPEQGEVDPAPLKRLLGVWVTSAGVEVTD